MFEAEQLYRLPKVLEVTGKCRTQVYADPSFPRPNKLGGRASAWIAREVHEWVQNQIKASRRDYAVVVINERKV
jgi:predicted DNA-binding transcriptional regulator AlpA